MKKWACLWSIFMQIHQRELLEINVKLYSIVDIWRKSCKLNNKMVTTYILPMKSFVCCRDSVVVRLRHRCRCLWCSTVLFFTYSWVRKKINTSSRLVKRYYYNIIVTTVQLYCLTSYLKCMHCCKLLLISATLLFTHFCNVMYLASKFIVCSMFHLRIYVTLSGLPGRIILYLSKGLTTSY